MVAAAGCLALFSVPWKGTLCIYIQTLALLYSLKNENTSNCTFTHTTPHWDVRRWNNKENCVDCLKTTTVRELRADATPFSQSMSPNNFAFILHFRFSFLFHFIYFSNLFGFNSFELKVLQQIEIKNFEIAVDGTVQTLR